MKKRMLSATLALACTLTLATPALATSDLTPVESSTINGNSYGGYAGRWADGFSAHLVETDDGYLRVEDLGEDSLLLEYYDDDFQLTAVDSVAIELEQYIAFHAGEDHYYLLFAQANPDEDDSVEVIRVVQYDKDWNRLAATSLSGINTIGYSSLTVADMAEADGNLLVHTNHTMYASSDGSNHQANLRITIDIDSMKLVEEASIVWNNSTGYVSHSFNQFVDVAADGGVYTADHGDAYPRSMAVFSWPSNSIVGKPTMVEVLELYGSTGANQTDAQLGGLEVSSTHALMAGISLPQTAVGEGTYNVYLTATSRSNFTSSGTDFTWVTDYDGSDVQCKNPYLLEVASDEFLLIWTEFTGTDCQLCWVMVEADGDLAGDIQRTSGVLSEVQPILNSDGDVVWYSTSKSIPLFYTLNVTTNKVTTTEAAVATDTEVPAVDDTAFISQLKGTPSDWALEEVLAAEEAGLVTAHSNDDFQTAITRFQFAELVVNLVETITGAEITPADVGTFSDTTSEAVLKASAAGIVNGMGDGLFMPNTTTNREQIATMLSRAIDYIATQSDVDLAPLSGDLADFTDAGEVSDWAVDAVALLAANGIMKGTSDTTLAPQNSATIEACILLVYRLFGNV